MAFLSSERVSKQEDLFYQMGRYVSGMTFSGEEGPVVKELESVVDLNALVAEKY